MKNTFSALKLTLLCLIFFSVLYPLAIMGIAHFAPNKGAGEVITLNEKVVGFQKIGQSFTKDNYFWGRPSAVAYNAAGSGGSNKGANNPEYLKIVQDRIDSFMAHNPTVKKEDIPAEMATASGSGLDPNISPIAAQIQINRIAKARSISANTLQQLIEANIQKPLLGMFGPSTVNVLELNLALDKIK
jgi:potassium-transporting ATPase KdpC subunit